MAKKKRSAVFPSRDFAKKSETWHRKTVGVDVETGSWRSFWRVIGVATNGAIGNLRKHEHERDRTGQA